MLVYSAPGKLGISQTRHPLIKFGTYKIRHSLNSANVKLGTYTFKSMFKQYYILKYDNSFPLKLGFHFNIKCNILLLNYIYTKVQNE